MGSQCSTPSSAPWYAHFFMDPGVKWCRMKLGNVAYMHAVPWIALVLLLVRSFMERWIATPIGVHFNVSDKTCRRPEKNETLSKTFEKCRNPGEDMLQILANDVGWTPYKVHKWFWRARQHSRPSQLTKFKESSWRFMIYAITSCLGIRYLSQEEFFWDRIKCYADFPYNTPSDPVLTYWACQLAFYVALLISHHSDTRRSDYLLMLFHHIFTVLLLGMAFVVNAVQIATLILLVHDISDVPLELAKLFKYIKYDHCAQLTFGVFSFVFFVTRLIIYPFFLLWSALFEYPVVISHSPAWWIMIIMLILLQGMHLYWFHLIYQMAKSLLLSHRLDGDVRSDPEYSPHTYDDSNSGATDCQEHDHLTASTSQLTVTDHYDTNPTPRKKYY